MGESHEQSGRYSDKKREKGKKSSLQLQKRLLSEGEGNYIYYKIY